MAHKDLRPPPLPSKPKVLQPSYSCTNPVAEGPSLASPYDRKKMSLDSNTPVPRLQLRSPSVVCTYLFDDDIYVDESIDVGILIRERDREMNGHVDEIDGPQNKETQFESQLEVMLIPKEIECETAHTIICTLKQDLIKQEQLITKITRIQIINIEGSEQEISFSYINNQTVQFTAPYSEKPIEIQLKISVLVQEVKSDLKSLARTEAHLKHLSYIPAKKNELADDLAHIYIDMVAQLLHICLDNKVDRGIIDKQLSSVFQDDAQTENMSRFSIQAFENIFRVGKNREKFDVTYPSLLHASSEYGLYSLTTILLDLPDSDAARRRKNCKGKTPFELCTDKRIMLLLADGYDSECDRSSKEENDYLPMDPNNRYTCPNLQVMLKSASAKSHRPPLPATPEIPETSPSLDVSPTPSTTSGVCLLNEDEMFKKGATSKSQWDLLGILEQVKKKNISCREADMLFKEWKLKEQINTGAFGGEKSKQNTYSQRSVDRKKTKLGRHFSNWLSIGRSNSISASSLSLDKTSFDLLQQNNQVLASDETVKVSLPEDCPPLCPPVPPRPPFLVQANKYKETF